MKKFDRTTLKAMSPEELIEGFVIEAKLTDLAKTSSIANRHVENVEAYTAEINERGILKNLAPLLESSDTYLAYIAASKLAKLEETKKRALAVLDRIADARIGSVSVFADRSRNRARYGSPLGPHAASMSDT